jgi:nitrate/nitrite transporter NarK
MDWLLWAVGLTSGAGALGYLAVALFAPKLLDIISPVLKGLLEGSVEAWKIEWEGFKDVVDSWQTVVFVATLCTVAYLYGQNVATPVAKAPTKQAQSSPSKSKKAVEVSQPFEWRFWE